MVVAYLVAADEASVGGRCRSVVLYGETVGAGIEVDAETAVVGGVWGRVGLRNLIVANLGAWLAGERVDAAGVVELAGVVADAIAEDTVVLHAGVVGSPPPTYADAAVVYVAHGVVGYGGVAHVATADGYRSPVLVGGIVYFVVPDFQSSAAACQIGVGPMHLAWAFCKRAGHDGRATDVLELAVDDHTLFGIVLKVEGCRPEVLESAFAHIDLLCILDSDGTHRALHPGLILQSRVPRQSFLFLQLIGIDEWETALQRYVASV